MASAATVQSWDVHRAEFLDAQRYAKHNRPKRGCIYCGEPTRSVSQICCRAHDDLPALDPDLHVIEAEPTITT